MTVTSNIHIGLAGWSNATYAVGDRTFNAGNAYVCSTPGTSTAPPTGTGTNIAPGGTSKWNYLSSVDYTDFQSWANAISSTLTQPVIGLVWNDGVISSSVGVQVLHLTGHTTSNTNTITIKPAPGDGFPTTFQNNPTLAYGDPDQSSGVVFLVPFGGSGNVTYFQIDDNYVTIQAIQFIDITNTSQSTIIGGSGTNCSIAQCILDGYSQAGGWNLINMTGAGFLLTNTLILDRGFGTNLATVFSSGAGTRVANNSFSLGSGQGTFAALDAGSNSTTASNTATNNIFYGYGDNVVRATSGIPWATNHNAYTNDSFTSLYGTDTGGSLFSIYVADVFVDRGGDFHLVSGSVCIDAGAADTTDIPSAIDAFGTSRPQGSSWDMGAHELLEGSVITQDFSLPIAISRSVLRESISQIEYNLGRSGILISIGSDWRKSSKFDNVLPADFLASFPSLYDDPFSDDYAEDFGSGSSIFNPSFSIEFRGSVPQPLRDTSISLEWKSSPISSASAPIWWGESIQRDALVSADFKASLPGYSSNPFSTDFSQDFGVGSQYRFDPSISIEFGSTTTASSLGPIEASASVRIDRTIQAASTNFFSRDVINPAEWKGVSNTLADQAMPIEWRSVTALSLSGAAEFTAPVQADLASRIEWISVFSSTDYAISVEIKGSTNVLPAAQIDWGSPLLSVNASAPVDFAISVRNTVQSGFEIASLIGASFTITCDPHLLLLAERIGIIEPQASRTVIALFPLEVGGTTSASVPSDSVMSLEWRGGMLADIAISAEIPGSAKADLQNPQEINVIKSVDYVCGSALGAVTLALMTGPMDWNHLLMPVSLDQAIPLEIMATVVADTTVPSNSRVGQRSIGSQLEPDEFERDHEPPA